MPTSQSPYGLRSAPPVRIMRYVAPTEFASRDSAPGRGGLRPALPETVPAWIFAVAFPGEKAAKAAEKLGIADGRRSCSTASPATAARRG